MQSRSIPHSRYPRSGDCFISAVKKFFFSLVQKRLDLLKHVLIYYFRVRMEGKVFLLLSSILFYSAWEALRFEMISAIENFLYKFHF